MLAWRSSPLVIAPKTQPNGAPALLLSAGSEVITVSLAEELREARAPIALAAFGQRSLLAGSAEVSAYTEVPWPQEPEHAVRALVDFARPLAERAGAPLCAFATDDAVLRLLFEHRAALEPYLVMPRARALPLSALDKAELFEFLTAQGLGAFGPPSVVLDSIGDLERARDVLGPEFVAKPALKPYRSELALDATGRKLLASWEYPDFATFRCALAAAWEFSPRWLAQARLTAPPDGEAVVWVLRVSSGETRCVSAVARWKHPPVGGTGCVVETLSNPPLEASARRLAQAIDLVGLAEFEFLLDGSGQYKLLECNVRPWLQVALARVAGLPVVALTWRALSGTLSELPPEPAPSVRSWVMPERLLLSVASASGARLGALARAAERLLHADYVPVYQSSLRGVRRAWFARVGRALLRRMRG